MIRVIDLETTGMEPPAEILEVGYTDMSWDMASMSPRIDGVHSYLFNSVNPITPETMAVHHITPKMVQGKDICSADELKKFMHEKITALVAHNSSFEERWFTPEIRGDIPFICTYKAALRVWPEAVAHNNSVLRYWLPYTFKDSCLHEMDEEKAMPPHRAAPDSYVTAYIFLDLLKKVDVKTMIQWTKEPKHMPRLTFGKHKDAKWGEVPADYLKWITDKSDMDGDTKWNAKRELMRRTKK
jgi:exodeoxyribonuclease X